MTNTDQQAPTTTEETSAGPFDGLKDAVRGLGKTVLDAGFHRAGGLTDRLTSRLGEFAEGKKDEAEEAEAPGPVANAVKEGVVAKMEGENPATAAIKGALGGVKNRLTGGGSKGGKNKFVNIVEWIDVGVPVRVAYNQWTEFERWSSFMKKLENAQRNEEEGKVAFKAQVFLSHRSWESSIVEMVPDDHIVWQSTGQKGYLNGGVTFHELGDPPMTRMCVVVEYHPQGVVEKTLQIWRSVGRAVRRELKRYVRQVQTSTILDQDGIEGWRAEIRDKKIVRTHDEVVEQEQREAEEAEAAANEEGDEGAAPEDEPTDSDQAAETDAEPGIDEDDAEPGIDEDDADAAEDATYLDEAGVGQQDEPADDEEPVDEDSTDEDEDEEPVDEEPVDEDSTDEDEGAADDEEEPQDADDSEDEGAEDEEEPEDAEAEPEDADEEPEDSGDTEDEGESDEDDDQAEDEGDGAEDEYEDEDEGNDSEYEDEDDSEGQAAADDSEGDGAEDEYEDEESEESDAEDSADADADADAEGEGDSGDEGGSPASSSTPTPKDVASGPVRPAETPRRPRRTPQRT